MNVRCPACGAVNRVPEGRVGESARCGKCKRPLATAGMTAGATTVVPVVVTDADFETVVLGAGTPVLLDCWAQWCGPCHALAPTIEALARAYAGRVVVGKLDVDANPRTANRFGIRSIPTVLLFDHGHLVDTLVGLQSRSALEARLQPLLAAR